MEEEALNTAVERARLGDSVALADIYDAFSRRVFGLCRYMLGSREAAEDATSEVFLRINRAVKSYNGSVPFPRWLMSVAAHHCVDVLRRQRVEKRVLVDQDTGPEQPRPGAVSALTSLLVEERETEVRRAIDGLPEKFRTPLVLRYYEEWSYDEIAIQLGLAKNHVAILIFRAKQLLRTALAPGASGPAS